MIVRKTAYGAAGFTLVELIVASTLMTIVLGTVYLTFSTSVRTWRSAESNYQTYEDARRAMNLLHRELQAIPGDAKHLMRGGNDWIEFVTLSPPLDVEDGSRPRLLLVRYRVGDSSDGNTLVREEAPVEGALPQPPSPQTRKAPPPLRVGRSASFVIAADVLDFRLAYAWAAPPRPRKPAVPPPRVRILRDSKVDGLLPEAVEATLTLRDPGNVVGREQTSFQTAATFRQATSPAPMYLLKREGLR